LPGEVHLVPAAVTPANREIDVLPHGIHLFPREDHLAFDASRQDRETLD
jgi:hypothetical protein